MAPGDASEPPAAAGDDAAAAGGSTPASSTASNPPFRRVRKGSNASNASNTSNLSMKSKISNLSYVRQATAGFSTSALKKQLTFTWKSNLRSTSSSLAELIDVDVGDHCETVSLVTLREEECLDSGVMMELPLGTSLQVTAVGEGRRIKVSNGSVEGWISSKTKLNEPLVIKRQQSMEFVTEDFEVGGQHEIKSLVTMRAEEHLDSEMKCELRAGTIIKILEIGANNKRRARVVTEAGEGWISLATKQGELLIGKVSEGGQAGGMFGASSSKIRLFLEAARSGDLDALKKIVEGNTGVMARFSSRPNLNSSDIRGKTALIYAAAFGNKDIVEFLLSKSREVDVNALDDTQKSALHHASKRARARRSTDYDQIQAQIVIMLLQHGAYLEARDHNGCTALVFAVANGDEAVARKLITARANVNVKDFEGHKPLDYAINFGHLYMVKMLKQAGAESDNADGEDPGPADEPAKAEEPEVEAEQETATAEEALPAEADGAEGAEVEGAEAEAKKAECKKKTSAKKKAASAEAGEKTEKPKKKSIAAEKEDGAKAAAKKKGKKPAKPAGTARMMEAVAEAEEEVPSVTVEEPATEEIDEKTRQLAKLASVMESTVIAGELEAAITVARSAGASEEDLESATKRLNVLKARADAREGLRAAISDRTCSKLREAISKAEANNVAKEEINDAKAVLAEEEPKEKAFGQLQEAQASGDTGKLKEAIAEAKKVNVDPQEVAIFEDLLRGAESKEQAEATLKSAVADKNVVALKFAIQQAKAAGIDAAQIKEAEEVLAVETPKQQAREELQKACETCTIEALTLAIEHGKGVGLGPECTKEAEELLQREHQKVRLLGGVTQSVEDSATVDMTDIDAIRAAKEAINTAIQDALKAGVAESALFKAEVRRKKLHNAIEDLKGSIRVFCRIRPLSKKEINQGDTQCVTGIDLQTLEIDKNIFQFDSLWMPGTQEEVFEDCKDLIQSAVDGYNVTMFAYGQTGAGKTFTMGGVPGMLGVSPRTIQEIFRVTKEGEARFHYTVMGSMLELYRNDLVDLLSKGSGKEVKKLNVRTDNSGSVSVEHLTEEECPDADKLAAVLERGNNQRTVAATAMNSESSRSHLVLMIKIISVNRETGNQLKGKILICDLAGSERLKKSQVTADGQKEAIEINKSLTALGDVVQGLTQGAKVIPYRNHKLTQLMQDSLGGSAKTLMFVNCSPANSNMDETIMALKYAQRAKTIKNDAKKKS